MTLEKMVYNKILEGNRISAYKTYDEFWYVIEWFKGSYIHYSHKVGYGQMKFLWFLSDSILCPKWKCQTKEFSIQGTTPNQEPPPSGLMP